MQTFIFMLVLSYIFQSIIYARNATKFISLILKNHFLFSLINSKREPIVYCFSIYRKSERVNGERFRILYRESARFFRTLGVVCLVRFYTSILS